LRKNPTALKKSEPASFAKKLHLGCLRGIPCVKNFPAKQIPPRAKNFEQKKIAPCAKNFQQKKSHSTRKILGGADCLDGAGKISTG
jgi:hypothetical protein